MRIFKNKVFRRFLSVLLLIVLLILLDTWLGDVLRPVSYADWFLHYVQEIEASGKSPDLMFIGASRTLRTFVPQVFREKLGMDLVLNAASPSQPISATYYELMDMVERLHPRHVMIGVTWNGLRNNGELQSRLIVYDRLSLKNKIRMVSGSFDISELPYLSGVYRFKDNFSLNKIESNIAEKKAMHDAFSGKNAEESDKHDYGFVYREGAEIAGNIKIMKDRDFSEKKIQDRYLQYLDACIELCQKNGIKVTLVSGVASVMRLYAIENYQGAVDYYSAYAKSKGIDYYNLNYLRDRDIFLPDDKMYDYNHVNVEGAFLVCERFAEFLNAIENGGDVSSYFYANLDELKKDIHRIVAVDAVISENSDNNNLCHISITSLQNDDVDTVYSVSVRQPGQEEYEIIRDWTRETELDLPLNNLTGGILRVEAGSTDESYGHAFQEYDLSKIF